MAPVLSTAAVSALLMMLPGPCHVYSAVPGAMVPLPPYTPGSGPVTPLSVQLYRQRPWIVVRDPLWGIRACGRWGLWTHPIHADEFGGMHAEATSRSWSWSQRHPARECALGPGPNQKSCGTNITSIMDDVWRNHSIRYSAGAMDFNSMAV